MTFDEVLAQVQALLQREQRVSYRGLKRRFALDDQYLEDLKEELIGAKRLASDEDGRFLVWVGQERGKEPEKRGLGESEQISPESSVQSRESGGPGRIPTAQTLDPRLKDSRQDAGERRQLTVMFCDLVGSTALSMQLDPEDLREVVRAYQDTCAAVIARYEGHIAQYLGDGVLVYFGYPVAHDEDAVRAVRSGLEIVAAVGQLAFTPPLQVRIGIHTGPVVVGEIGEGARTERLALGETPNLAACVQGHAEPNTVLMSAATYRLVQGLFACHELEPQPVKGLLTPLSLYRVVGASVAQSRFEVAVQKGLTPLVGRAEELALLQQRWEQAKASAGQVVLLSGEPGIGKSRLVQELKEHVSAEGATRLEFRCSSYHQHSALYPIIDHLQRFLQFQREDTASTKLSKLQQVLATYRFPQADTVPLLATLLSLPHPEGYPPLMVSPQKQKERTQAALVEWLVEETEKAALYCAWEDLHWADPSTLEVLTLFLDQVPMARLLALLTFRPEFTPPWGNHSHISQMTLSRLGRHQVEAMVEHVVAQTLHPLRVGSGQAAPRSERTECGLRGETPPVRAESFDGLRTGSVAVRTTLPTEVMQQIVAKTDGVPLFVEELTKMVVESGLLREEEDHYELTSPLPPLAIPSTLQDSLMARLDRLAPVKEVVQLGATLGREFSYDVLQAVSVLDEVTLQRELARLVDAEFLFQRGLPPQALYFFKHALVQETAYQSLLKSKRQQYHKQIAQVLEEKFTEIKETQPELLAHHYTEAGLGAQAIPYWQQAGQRAIRRSAHMEAIKHLTKGLELLKALPDTPEHIEQELTLQLTLGIPLTATKGFAAPEVEEAYTRARELCRTVGETPQLFSMLRGLWRFYMARGKLQQARELGEQLLSLAQNIQDLALLLSAHLTLGETLLWLGELLPARTHLAQGIAYYDPQKHRSRTSVQDAGVVCLSHTAVTLWLLGYPDQTLREIHKALTLAQDLSHLHSMAFALDFAAGLHQYRREGRAAQERAEAAITLSTNQGFAQWLAMGTILRGWALAEQGQGEEGIPQMRQGLAAWRATGAELGRLWFLAMLAEGYRKVGQAKEGLTVVAEAMVAADNSGERWWEAELYRLKGQLVLQSTVKTSLGQVSGKSQASQDLSKVPGTQHRAPSTPAEAEAEVCFLKAIEIAQKQQAKSLELRAAMSLSRLWQQQGKKDEAQQLLAEIYDWFTEGFDTKDLQEAKALIEELSQGLSHSIIEELDH